MVGSNETRLFYVICPMLAIVPIIVLFYLVSDGFAFLHIEVIQNVVITLYSELQIRLVGRMLGKVERVTDVVFTLDDGTGKIDVNRW